jgi:GntR family transcriptional regulator, transcriptional repressor for pyruvate dehydrogenase complex
MTIDVKPATRVGVAQATVATLQNMIQNGQMKAGAPMPPERELASELRVSRASLRQALSILATMGLISIQPGRGTFVCEPRQSGAAGPPMPSWHSTTGYSPAEVYQFRYIAESHATQLAAMRHTPAKLQQIQENLEGFRRATREPDIASYMRIDFEFHDLIIMLSGNRILSDMHRSFAKVILASQHLPLTRRAILWDAVVEHERIVEALTMSDPEGAGYYMRQHVSRSASRAGISIPELT